MTKIAIKSDKITPFGGIFSIMQQFDRSLSQVIDSTLGVRCKFYGYQYTMADATDLRVINSVLPQAASWGKG